MFASLERIDAHTKENLAILKTNEAEDWLLLVFYREFEETNPSPRIIAKKWQSKLEIMSFHDFLKLIIMDRGDADSYFV